MNTNHTDSLFHNLTSGDYFLNEDGEIEMCPETTIVAADRACYLPNIETFSIERYVSETAWTSDLAELDSELEELTFRMMSLEDRRTRHLKLAPVCKLLS